MSPEELRDRITAITNAEQRALISFIRQYVHSIDLAEDCLQAAYLEALEHAQEINKPECLLSWLYTVSKRCAIREIAYKSRLMRCCIKFPISRTISTEEELMQNIVLRRWTKGYTIKQSNMDCQPTEITALMRHRAVFS